MTTVQEFWQHFSNKDFVSAQACLDALNDESKQAVLERLYQQAGSDQKPVMVSVLRRTLHDDQSFDDFYREWFPPKKWCNPVEEGGQVFQQSFDGCVRVVNAINADNPKEVLSVGIVWVSNDEEEQAMWRFMEAAKRNEIEMGRVRGERIAKVADGEFLGAFKVEKDDNLGTPF